MRSATVGLIGTANSRPNRRISERLFPQPLTCTAQRRPDRVLRNTDFPTDLSITPTLEVIESNDLCVLIGKPRQQLLDFIPVLKATFVTIDRNGLGRMRIHVSHRFGHSPLGHFLNDDSARDDGQIGRERALAAKSTQNRVIVFEKSDEDLRTKVIDKFRRQWNTSRLGRMVHDMDEQSEKAVDEISPCARLIGDAAFQKVAVDLGKSHGDTCVVRSAAWAAAASHTLNLEALDSRDNTEKPVGVKQRHGFCRLSLLIRQPLRRNGSLEKGGSHG